MIARERVEAVITRIRPVIQADGGDIELVDVVDNKARIRMSGNCIGCPSAQMSRPDVDRRRPRVRPARGRDRTALGRHDRRAQPHGYGAGDVETVKGSVEIPGRRDPALVPSIVAGPPGRLWVGTHGMGLGLVDTSTLAMEFWRQDPSRRDSLSEDKVLALLPDRAGALWIGTWGGGLNRLSPVSQRFDGPGDGGFPPVDVRDRDVTALLDDRRGGVWLGTRTGFVLRLDPATGAARTLYRGGAEGVSRIIIDLELDRLGRLWMGTSGKETQVAPPTALIRAFKIAQSLTASLPSSIASVSRLGEATEPGSRWSRPMTTGRKGGRARWKSKWCPARCHRW